ncbi:hypothetical protein [Lacihabitans lacunae]|uniref:Beta-carotene 15,15'-monooxygenase n=1 Tax=Lacihabitans lacunae TaxID=1028214 RepID=A0ABV7YS31_9BACT
MTENNTFFAEKTITNSDEMQSIQDQNSADKTAATISKPDFGMVKRVDLTQYAIDRSMSHKGDARALNNMFNEIRSGHLIDESADFEYQEKHRFKLTEQIIQLEKESEEMLGEKLKVKEVNIPSIKAKVVNLESELHDWNLKLQQPADKDIMNTFSLWKYGIAIVLGLLYICMFYISCIYMGMVRNPMAEAQVLYENGGDVNGLFSAIFSMKAFKVFDFHYVSPILLLIFAILLDYIHSNYEGWRKIVGLISAGLITLVLDAFIAYKIENTNYEMKKLMGIEDPSHVWYLSSDFYIVLIMGFVATLVWGILLIAFKKELQKTDYKKVIGIEMSYVKKQISELKDEISKLELILQDLETRLRKILLDIKKLGDRKSDMRISIPELERYIAKFFDGWMEVVAVLKDENIKAECQQVYENFRSNHLGKNQPALAENNDTL